MAKPKAETSKSEKDKSPNKNPRTFRKSPARTEKQKSPGKVADTSYASPSGRGPVHGSPSRRSPSRKSPSRKSPSRKSPGRTSPVRRSPARKSPTRKPATPGRRSPARQAKVEKSVPEKPKSPGRPRKTVIELDSDSDSAELSRQASIEKPKAAVRGRARRLDADYMAPKVILHDIQSVVDVPSVDREISSYVGLVRRSFRKSLSREVDRVVHLKHNDATVRKLTEFSDEDDISVSHSNSGREKSERYSEPKVIEERIPKSEFGGWIGALILILSTPCTIISLFVFCSKTHCSLTKLPNFQQYKYFSTYIDTTAFLIFLAFSFLMAILTALPFGGFKVNGLPNKQGRLNYVTNGLFAIVVTSLMVIALEFFNVPVTTYITKKCFQLVVSSLITGILFSIYLYIRSFFVPISALNPYATNNSRIYNFWVGREVNPRPLNVIDVKLLLVKIFAVGVVIINAAFIYKNVQFTKPAEVNTPIDLLKSVDFNPTLLLISTLQIIYAVDSVLFEYVFLSSFEIQYEGAGYMSSILGFTAPFVTTLIPKYVYEHEIKLPAWQLVSAGLLFFIGYFLYRASNLQKHAFRQNPYSPALSHLESIPTAQGKKLLVSGFWGFVRHPNYLGDLLIWSSFALFALNVSPLFVAICDFVYLIHRTHRDGARCKQRYGTAWDRYCQRVKYVLIPKVY